MKKSVCIIGAGPSGLASLKNVLISNSNCANSVILEAVVYEQASDIGGVWNYDEELAQTGECKNPMYTGLRTNLPKEMMRFIDFSPDNYDEKGSYVSRQDIFNYLQKYAKFFGLNDYIKFNRKVTSVKPILKNGLLSKWNVTVQNTKNVADVINSEFDAVIVCKGSQCTPKFSDNYEQIKNSFKGQILHSIDYNKAEEFRDRTVLLIGGGPSGRDLSVEISRVAKKVYLSLHNFEKQAFVIPPCCQNLEFIRTVSGGSGENSVLTSDGREIQCDVIIFCTGYLYNFPFLQPGVLEIIDGGKHVTPLYLHMIHRKFPSLCILGLADLHLPFLLSDCQSRFYASYLRGEVLLPSEEQMTRQYEADQAYRKMYSIAGPHSHIFHSLQWLYMRKLADASGFRDKLEEFLPTLEKIFFTALEHLNNDPFGFRERNIDKILQDSMTSVTDPTGLNLDAGKDPLKTSGNCVFGSVFVKRSTTGVLQAR